MHTKHRYIHRDIGASTGELTGNQYGIHRASEVVKHQPAINVSVRQCNSNVPGSRKMLSLNAAASASQLLDPLVDPFGKDSLPNGLPEGSIAGVRGG